MSIYQKPIHNAQKLDPYSSSLQFQKVMSLTADNFRKTLFKYKISDLKQELQTYKQDLKNLKIQHQHLKTREALLLAKNKENKKHKTNPQILQLSQYLNNLRSASKQKQSIIQQLQTQTKVTRQQQLLEEVYKLHESIRKQCKIFSEEESRLRHQQSLKKKYQMQNTPSTNTGELQYHLQLKEELREEELYHQQLNQQLKTAQQMQSQLLAEKHQLRIKLRSQ